MPILTHNGKVLKYQSPKQIIVTNGGGIGTTDWVDSNSDGLANSWGGYLTQFTYTIVTGNGFVGNAQRFELYTTSYTTGLIYESNITVPGHTYKLSFKYRSNCSFRMFLGGTQSLLTLSINAGDAVYAEIIFISTLTGTLRIYGNTTFVTGNWVEIDEVNVQEIYCYNVLKHGWGDSFVFTINTALDTTASITLPLRSGYNYDFWWSPGDGSARRHVTSYNDPNASHIYAAHGTYQIIIDGICEAWYFGNAGDKLKITSVDNWGNTNFKALSGAFQGCTNLLNIPQAPLPYYGTTLASMFMYASNVGDSIPSNFLHNIPTLTSLQQTFQGVNMPLYLDFLKYNPLLTNVSYLHYIGYITSKSIPEDYFYYNKLITNYAYAFSGNRDLILPTRLFDLSVINIVTSFSNFMPCSAGYSFTGTIQDIWNYAISALHTNAFLNQVDLDNYSSIPNDWKGL